MKNIPAGKSRSLWITLEAEEVIELKRINQDRDGEGAAIFFRKVLIPRLRDAALKRGVALDLLTEEKNDERLPG